jgi:hypothetical protein
MHCKTEDLSLDSMLKPPIIDLGDGVARAEDHIDEVFPRVGLAKPAWISDLREVPSNRKHLQHPLTIPGSYEDIEIFRVPHDACMTSQGICPTYKKWHLGVLKATEGSAVKVI